MYLDERSNVLLKEILRHPNISNAKLQEKFGLTRRQVDYSFQKVNQWLEEQAYPKIHRSANGRFVVEPDLFQLVEKKDEWGGGRSVYLV
ncbi:PTS system IIA 2 domain protein [Listeria cornellensis FSL F6-0969]|uniref:PTS system IIA 2 domain protein n=1 Tax=Listeria cornellensis FSL F6-0969 TaxID=1265820 RepID=W7C844_9LIST|nr:PTS system IIA 2 domain protein [Listeria cornellensis FSL F6-0969]